MTTSMYPPSTPLSLSLSVYPLSVCLSLSLSVGGRVCVCARARACVCVYVCVRVYVCICVSVCVLFFLHGSNHHRFLSSEGRRLDLGPTAPEVAGDSRSRVKISRVPLNPVNTVRKQKTTSTDDSVESPPPPPPHPSQFPHATPSYPTTPRLISQPNTHGGARETRLWTTLRNAEVNSAILARFRLGVVTLGFGRV